MRRRSFITAAAAAVPLIGIASSPVEARPLDSSPLFGAPKETAHSWRVSMLFSVEEHGSVHSVPFPHSAIPMLNISLVALEPTRPIRDMRHAEDIVFGLGTGRQIYEKAPIGGVPCVGDCYPALAILINRGANLIAAKTRRAAGNMAFMHPDAAQILREHTSQYYKLSTGEMIGRWTKSGMLNNQIVVYTSPTHDRDSVSVVYANGPHDGPAQLVCYEGQNHICILPDLPDALGNAGDYVQKIAIRW